MNLDSIRQEFQELAQWYLDQDEETKKKFLSDLPGIRGYVEEFLSLALDPQLWVITSAFSLNYKHFSMLGIDDPEKIINDPDEWLPELFPTLNDLLRYQFFVYRVIVANGWREILQQQALDDLNSPLDEQWHEFGTVWGTSKAYTTRILKNFLSDPPNWAWILPIDSH